MSSPPGRPSPVRVPQAPVVAPPVPPVAQVTPTASPPEPDSGIPLDASKLPDNVAYYDPDAKRIDKYEWVEIRKRMIRDYGVDPAARVPHVGMGGPEPATPSVPPSPTRPTPDQGVPPDPEPEDAGASPVEGEQPWDESGATDSQPSGSTGEDQGGNQ